jgi:hypothetical protein
MNEQFEKDGYLVIRNFLETDFCKFVKTYFKVKKDTLDYTIDPQAPEGASWYGDPLMETILLTSCKFISEKTELDLMPTYSYSRIYGLGDHLHKHRDRPACEISATVCLARPEDEPNSAIYMAHGEDDEGEGILLEPGDMVIYQGCRMHHWREPFESSWFLQSFLHYVDINGENISHQLDGRRCLAIQKGPELERRIGEP